MSVNASNLHTISNQFAPQSLAECATVRSHADILDGAIALEREARAYGLRLMVWPDLATFASMLDADGDPVNIRVFGWGEEQIEAWQEIDDAARARLLRLCRTQTDFYAISRHEIGLPVGAFGIAAQGRSDSLDGPFVDHAVIVPVLLQFGQIAAALVIAREPLRSGLIARAQWFATNAADAIRRFIAGYVELTQDQRYLPPDTVLSHRDVECLGWIAHGKTDFEISVILGCSHAGVRYHLTRACTKLDANNRAQAVFRAGQLGLISPSFAGLENGSPLS